MSLNPQTLLDPANVQNPYAFYDEVRATAPVWEVGDKVFTVTAFAPLAEAARRVEDFSSVMRGLLYKTDAGLPAAMQVPAMDPTLATADPPIHTQHKQMIFPKFVAKRMATIEDELVEYTRVCIGRARSTPEFDFMDVIGSAVPIRAIARLVGFRDSNDELLRDTAFESVEYTAGTKTLTEIGQIRSRMDEIQAWMMDQLDQREGDASEDLLDAVKAALDSGKFTRGEAMITLMTLLAAGGESTSSLLGNAVRMLAEQPELRRMIQGDMSLLPAFIEEAGRLQSPFQHHLRSTEHDTELAGVKIPAGAAVMLMWGAANRDPDKFEEPNAFRFGRSLQHVVFGRGIHQCVGSSLARMEARIVIGELLKLDRFPEVSASETPEYEYSLQVRRHRRLLMTW